MDGTKAKLETKDGQNVSIGCGMGLAFWIWLFFFQWTPVWKEGLVLLVAAYLIEVLINKIKTK
jgi:hypothetical protein